MPTRIVTTLAAAVVAAAAIAVSASAVTSVSVGDNYFVRSSGVPTVSAAANSRLTFRFIGRSSHNVRVRSGPKRFSSPTKSRGGTYRTPALSRGTYVIYCSIHGQRDQSMKLVVR